MRGLSSPGIEPNEELRRSLPAHRSVREARVGSLSLNVVRHESYARVMKMTRQLAGATFIVLFFGVALLIIWLTGIGWILAFIISAVVGGVVAGAIAERSRG